MIKLESIHIEEIRGIRKLDLDFHKEKFAICGPNGSGKSGVIDAIEFGLTGQMGRLTGRGTKGLSVADHGPHVDKVNFPDVAFVKLKVYLTELKKEVTITRAISSPKKPKIEPPDADVKAVLEEIADHPEISLSRRDILRFILVEPTKRSEEIQALLKLDEIGQTRSALNAAHNRLANAFTTSTSQVTAYQAALTRHLQIATLRSEDLLAAVNKRRKVLDLPVIEELTSETKLDVGIAAGGTVATFNKDSAIRDIEALLAAETEFPNLATKEASSVVSGLVKLAADPLLLSALQHRFFVEKGLSLVVEAACPLCDKPWPDAHHLREHLKAKLSKSEEAQKLQDSLLKDGAVISDKAVRLVGLLSSVHKLVQAQGEAAFAQVLIDWKSDLEVLRTKLTTLEKMSGVKDRMESGWTQVPAGFSAGLSSFSEKIKSKPDQTATIDAQTFLTAAQMRLGDYREARRGNKGAEAAKKSSKLAYDTYCIVLEEELNALYNEVQTDFSGYYRAINESDESKFTAKLTPTAGSLGLDVNFYERGLFPPAAYHSEGHQDGMGLCLYLALMKRLFGGRFTFSLLDDVVMSVDSGHRFEFCKLLKTQFPDTQFIITTHDKLWAEQMKTAGVVTSKTSLTFHSWTVDTGPLVASDLEIWSDIDVALKAGKIDAAAFFLRHHLEYISQTLADQIGARPQFHSDGNYDLGDMLPSVLVRMKQLWGKAADSAQSWKKEDTKEECAQKKERLSTCNGAANVQQWAINPAVHFNAWANFSRQDFEPVVAAFKELLSCFRCEQCNCWIYVQPRINPGSLRCDCNAISFNLKPRPA